VRAERRLSLLAVAAGSAMCAAAASVGADARWLGALGEAVAHLGRIPSSVPYAAAPSHDWVNVPVLGELVFHGLQVAGGDRALIAAQAVAVALTLTLLSRDMRSGGATDGARALVLVALPFAVLSAFFVVRVQLFSLPLFAATALLLRAESRRRSRYVWLLVPLVALWSNLHGAVLTGVLVASVYLVVERARHERLTSLGVLLASWGALFATPAFLRTGDYYLGVLHSEPAAHGLGLWAPLSLRSTLDVVFVAFAVPLLLLALRARPRAWELVCLVLLAAATVHASRNSVWVALFVAVPAACGLNVRELAPKRRLLVTAVWALPIVLVVSAFTQAPAQRVAGGALRAQAAQIAAGGPILADAENAEQLAVDGRRVWIANPIDAFTMPDQRAYLEWLRGRADGDALLLRQRVVLVRRGSAPQRRLAHRRDFREVARDAVAVLYRRVS
jgi:hypothetical protein